MKANEIESLLSDMEEALMNEELETVEELGQQVLEMDPENVAARLMLGGVALEFGDADEAMKLAQEAFERAPEMPEASLLLAQVTLALDLPDQTVEHCARILQKDAHHVEARYYTAEALLQLGGVREAAELFELLVEENPEDASFLLGLGVSLYESCEFDGAMQALEAALELEDDLADAYFYQGLILERRDQENAAKKAFKKAEALDPDAYPVPLKVSVKEINEIANEVLKDLPKVFQDAMVNVVISVEEIPTDADLSSSEPPLSPSLWGLFRGHTIAEAHEANGALPPEIVLYRRNLQRGVRSREELLEEIRVTLQHEIAHFLGLSEEDVERMGLA